MSQREAEQNVVRRFGPADRFAVPIKALFLMASLATAGVGFWLLWVIAVILPAHDPAQIPMWRTVAVCFFVYSALSWAFLVWGPRIAVFRWTILAASVVAIGLGLYGVVYMVLRAFAGADVEGYIMLMGLLLCGHGFVAIVYTLLTGRIRRADPGLLGLVLGFTVGCFASSAAAAPPDSSHARGSGALIFELGFADAIHRSNSGVDSKYGTIDAGYLRRTSERTLVGGDVSFSFHDAGSFWALRPRLRRELNRNWGIDLAAGVIVAGQANAHGVDGLGVSALTELNYRGLVGVTLGLESVKYSPLDKYGTPTPSSYSGRVTTTQLGVRVGKKYGVIAALALGVAALAAVASL